MPPTALPSLFRGALERAWLRRREGLLGLGTRSTDLRPARQGELPLEKENGKVGVSGAWAETGKEGGVGQEVVGGKIEAVGEGEALYWGGRKGERGFQEGPDIRSVLGLHIYTVEGVHRWALN